MEGSGCIALSWRAERDPHGDDEEVQNGICHVDRSNLIVGCSFEKVFELVTYFSINALIRQFTPQKRPMGLRGHGMVGL